MLVNLEFLDFYVLGGLYNEEITENIFVQFPIKKNNKKKNEIEKLHFYFVKSKINKTVKNIP